MITDPHAVTPVERHGDYWYKRDDLFVPFADMPISGGKVRQALLLLSRARQRIVDDYGGVVLTASGVHSPQGLIVARAARALELACVVFVSGNGKHSAADVAMRHAVMRRVLEVGATLDVSAKLGYEGPLAAAMQRWRRAHDGRGFVVRFGINLEDDPAAVLASTAAQVLNVPRDVRCIVVPVGAGITAAGIILGVRSHLSDVRVVCVQIAGLDRRATIGRIVGSAPYDWHELVGIPYSTALLRHVDGFTLDPIYEAKAHDWMLQHDDVCPRGESLFWLVGDSTAVRRAGASSPPRTHNDPRSSTGVAVSS